MDRLRIPELIRKYNSGNCTSEEKLLLEQWFMSFEWDANSLEFDGGELQELKSSAWQSLYMKKTDEDIKLGGQARSVNIRRAASYRWYMAAAVVLVLIGAGSIYKYSISTSRPAVTANKNSRQPDILPGGRKALLQMANGSVITLDSLQTASLNEKDGTQIQKKGGELFYHESSGRGEAILFNTLSTPRGGEYQLVLPDGSKVWLNAASSLRFPTRFTGSERKVYLTGEAYFEVKKNPGQPFRVNIVAGPGTGKDMDVEVLGTQFVVNAYSDEQSINTTLVEGSVKVKCTDKSVLLTPGEQAQLGAGRAAGSALRVVKDVNVDEIIAWKEGNFHFESADLSEILRQFARWYDIDLVYDGRLKPRKFFGIISRSSTLANVLTMLKANDIDFRIDGKRLIVQPK